MRWGKVRLALWKGKADHAYPFDLVQR
jgi:hypothetical protein